MSNQGDERSGGVQHNILAVSKDEAWLQFAKKILRRTDHVQTLKDLNEVPGVIEKGDQIEFL